MKIAYLARNDGTDMRISKECNSLQRAGHDVTFVGWRADLHADLPDPMPAVRKQFNSGVSASGKIGRQVAYWRHAAQTLDQIGPQAVHCSNEENAFLALWNRRRKHGDYRVVCDIFDSLALRMSDAAFPIRMASRKMADWVYRGADHVIVTDDRRLERLGRFRERASIVPNYPVDPGESVALEIETGEDRICLLVAGSLSAARGLELIEQILNRRTDIFVLAAGWLYDDAARAFVTHERVDYRGVVTPAAALKLAGACDAIVALYAPTNENNVLASPNKVYDALCVGRPIIINSETAISDWILEVDAGPVVPYGDPGSFEAAIDGLPRLREEKVQQARRLRRLFEEGYSWSVAEGTLLRVYENLGAQPAAAGVMKR